MHKSILIAGLVTVLGGALSMGCDSWLVGAPCVPETDKGSFNQDLQGKTFAIETRSVQCQGSSAMVCLTKTEKYGAAKESNEISDIKKYEGTQVKHSFCSCRCKDAQGHSRDRNSDKFDDLCECPGGTVCENVLGDNIEGAPEKIRGSYCLPDCVSNACEEDNEDETCTPSSNSEEPWKWSCKLKE